MIRRLASLAAAGALLLAACGSPAAPAITDPKEILVKSVEAIQNAKTVHIDADVTGKLNVDLTGQGAGGGLDLTGTTLTGDVDLAGKKLHANLSAPALFGTGADIIETDGVTYTKLSGPLSQSSKYQKQAATGTDTPADPVQAISDIKAGLDKLTTPPTKAADERCGDADCYHVTLNLTSTDLGSLASAVPGVSGAATLDVWSRKDNLRPSKLTIAIDAGAQGTVTVTVNLTNYDSSVSIQAPPADQVEG